MITLFRRMFLISIAKHEYSDFCINFKVAVTQYLHVLKDVTV